MLTRVKNQSEIKAMREAGRMLSEVLQEVINNAKVGISTKELAVVAAEYLKKLGGKPSFLGYQGFPDVICISVNDEVVHGIPSQHRKLEQGDIVGFDFGVTYKGMVTDAARSVIIGKPKEKRHLDLVRYTEEALLSGISAIKNDVRTGDIAYNVQKVLERHKYGIVRDLVGHGVGHYLHEDPNIPNYGRMHSGPWLKKNMTIAVEPMSTLGGYEVKLSSDGWTVLTADGSWSAHFEHTVLITEDGYEILTAYSKPQYTTDL
jgi:methionyl aminopeptidase